MILPNKALERTLNEAERAGRQRWAEIQKFLLPEEAITLNMVFINLRNYLMCAAVVGAVGALEPAHTQSFIPWTLIMFTAFLMLANALQSWLIIQKWTSRVGARDEANPNWGRLKRRMVRIFVAIVMVAFVAGMIREFFLLTIWALRGGP
jgi:hypothetical protein